MSEIDWSKAPEGATHAAFGDDNVPGWYRKEAGCWLFFPDSCGPAKWTTDCSQEPERERPSLICRADQWRGPEYGLPPCGVECEGYVRAETANHGAPGNKWLRGVSVGEAVAPNGGVGGLLKAEDGKVHFIGACTHFRPLKSDKERAIDAAVAATILKDGPRIRSALSDIYDAGLLRLPEEQS